MISDNLARKLREILNPPESWIIDTEETGELIEILNMVGGGGVTFPLNANGDGTAANPMYQLDDTDSGIYSTGDGNVSISANSAQKFSINQNEVFVTVAFNPYADVAVDLGQDSKAWNVAYVREIQGSDGYALRVKSQDNFSGSNGTWVSSGNVSGAGNSGDVVITSGVNTGTGNTGQISLYSGAASDGDSGDIELYIEIASGTRGNIRFVDGSEGTAGHVWTAVDTGGNGAWMPAGTLTGSNNTYVAFDGSGNAGNAPSVEFINSATDYAGMRFVPNIADTVTSYSTLFSGPTIDGADIVGLRGFEFGGAYGQTEATTIDNQITIQVNEHFYSNVTIDNYTALGIGSTWDTGCEVTSGMNQISLNASVDLSGSVPYFNGVANFPNFGNNGPGVEIVNYNGYTEGAQFHNATTIENYLGFNIGPQFNDTTTVDTFTGMLISVGGNGDITNATGLRITMNSGATISGNNISIETQGGHLAISSSREIISGQTFQTGNEIGGNNFNTAAITGTDFIGNSLANTFTVADDIANGPLGIGQNLVGFVGQIQIASGKTVDQFSGVISGFSWADANGAVTDSAAFVAAGSIGAGGTITNNRAFYVSPLFNSSPATNAWGFFNGTDTNNYFEKNVLIGTSSPTNASVALEINSTTKALRLPRMTTTEKNALTALTGMFVYDSTLNQASYYNGSSWVNI